MITEKIYQSYIGVATAPTNIIRLEYLALQEIKKIIMADIPLNPDDEDLYSDEFLNALMEQIKYFDENEDLLSSGGSGYSLGKFKEGSSSVSTMNNRISPMTYTILLNLGLLYCGIGVVK